MQMKIQLSLLLLICLSAVEASAGSALRFRLTAEPNTLDWTLARSSHETYVIMNLMEGLVEEGPDLRVRPALAEHWEVSPDGKTYTFFLREGVKWSDGRPLKASDFEDSWFRLLDPKTRSDYASFLFEIENAEAFYRGKISDRAKVGIKALSPTKFQVKLRQRVPYFEHLMTFWVTFPIRADLIQKHGKKWATPSNMATVGPYVLSGWKKGKSIQLKKNPQYFGAVSSQAPEMVEALVEPNDQKARELFSAGKIDVLLNATTQDLMKPQSGGTRVEQYPYLATYYLGFNVKAGPLKDPEIRKALSLAIDREAIPSVLQGGQTAARSWFPPGIPGVQERAPEQSSGLYEARAALSKAGYTEGQRFPKLTFLIDKFDGAERLGSYIVDSLKQKLGIQAEARYGTIADLKKSGAEVSIFIARWGADYPDAENFLSVFESGNGTNLTGWTSKEYDTLLEQVRRSADPVARVDAVGRAEDILLRKEFVILPLFYKKNTVLLGKRLEKFEISPLNYLFLKNVSLKE